MRETAFGFWFFPLDVGVWGGSYPGRDGGTRQVRIRGAHSMCVFLGDPTGLEEGEERGRREVCPGTEEGAWGGDPLLFRPLSSL